MPMQYIIIWWWGDQRMNVEDGKANKDAKEWAVNIERPFEA
jgi:hypothetical protein